MTVLQAVDVLVVGLGPGGSSAAIAAATAGCSVIAIERNAKAGLPVQCAEFVPLMVGTEAEFESNYRVQQINSMETFVEGTDKELTPDFSGQMIDRAAFDQSLVSKACSLGVDTRFSTPFRGVSEGIVQAGKDAFFKPKVLIGADGPRSLVGRQIGSSNNELVETRQITVPLLEVHVATDIFLSADIVGGYGWLFPKGDVANLGLGVVPAEKANLKGLLNRLHQQLIDKGRVGSDVLHHTGGLIPVGGLQKLEGLAGSLKVMLVGDAAGLTNAVTGAGIHSAVISGRMAGEAAADFINGDGSAPAEYSEDVEDLFGPSLERAVARREQLIAIYSSGRRPDPDDLRSAWIAYPQYWSNKTTNSFKSHTGEMRMSA